MTTRNPIKSILTKLAVLGMSAISVMAADETKPIKMLFIGNSFTQMHNIPEQVRDFAERGNPGLNLQRAVT